MEGCPVRSGTPGAVMSGLLFVALLSCSTIPAALSGDNFQECGIRYTVNRHRPVISHGYEAQRLEYPWHVALFSQCSPSQEPEYICGGSIIQHNVIITAAHCVYNESTFSIDNASFTVVVGKYYRIWNYTDPNEQKFEVSDIRIPNTYLGLPNRYADDIAILALNNSIKFSSTVMPVCVDWSSEYNTNSTVNTGTVVGWGYTQHGNLSNELMVAKLNYFNFTSCREVVDYDFWSFVTSDKFCAGVDNGTTVEQGDSGGGFVTPRNSSGNVARYYLLGIVSTKDTWDNRTAAFTDVSIHLRWIKYTIESLKDSGYCKPLTSSRVEFAQCNDNGTYVGCDAPSKRGTKAKVRCKNSFHDGKPYRLLADTECSENHTWAPLTDSCLKCGIRYTEIRFQKERKPEQWHVGIYNGSDGFKHVCDGTLFHPKAVLTAASCVYSDLYYRLEEHVEWYAAIGKRHCDWNVSETWEQRFKVSQIFVKKSYEGFAGDYMDNIAILKLNDTVKLSEYIMPPCIDWSGTLQLYKNPLVSGLSMAFRPNKQIYYFRLRFLERKECMRYTFQFQWPLTDDMICTTPDDGSGLMEFRGSALTYSKYNEETGEQINYLYGIASNIAQNILRFTNITYHSEWINHIMLSNITIN